MLTRLKPDDALADIELLDALDIRWAEPTGVCAQAIELARLDYHLFDMLCHALALGLPGATLVTADRRYFDKARCHLGRIAWLPDWRSA